jgi:hypothetical protein
MLSLYRFLVHAICFVYCLACSIACRGNVMLAEVCYPTLPLKSCCWSLVSNYRSVLAGCRSGSRWCYFSVTIASTSASRRKASCRSFTNASCPIICSSFSRKSTSELAVLSWMDWRIWSAGNNKAKDSWS